MDSFSKALGDAAKSTKGKTLIAMLRPYVVAALMAAGGWLAHSWRVGERMEAAEARDKKMAEDVAAIKLELTRWRTKEQQELLQVGKQAAYATAFAAAYETAKRKKDKRSYANDYASAYETMLNDGKPPEFIFRTLLRDVELP